MLRFELFRVRTSACAPQNDQSVSLARRTAKLNLLARTLAVFDHTSTLRPMWHRGTKPMPARYRQQAAWLYQSKGEARNLVSPLTCALPDLVRLKCTSGMCSMCPPKH